MYFIKVLILFLMPFLEIKLSQQLFHRPATPNPTLSALNYRLRQTCGYRLRPLEMTITYPKKCFMRSYDNLKVFKPRIEKKTIVSNRAQFGRDAHYGESPWAVESMKVVWRNGLMYLSPDCTGSLITWQHILTVAHCYFHENETYRFFVGNQYRNLNYPIISTNFTYQRHPNFTGGFSSYFDIAIIRLNKPIDPKVYKRFRKTKYYVVNPVCLPHWTPGDPEAEEGFQYEKRSQLSTFYGWGIGTNATDLWALQRGNHYVSFDSFGNEFYSHHNLSQGCPGDSGAGLVQYVDKYETRAVLIGSHTTSDYNESYPEHFPPCSGQVIISYYVGVEHHLGWIYSILDRDGYYRRLY